MDHKQLLQLATHWQQIDKTPAHQQVLNTWIESEDFEALRESFGARLDFGTAGLRGAVGPGTNNMNRGLVQQTAYGIAQYVHTTSLPKRLVIGYDARRDSRQFAQDTADVFATEGFEVYLFDVAAPTPIIAYSVTWLKCTVGIIITASHNPAPDNGFKVYWENGAQIVPPTDKGIAHAIASISNMSLWDTHLKSIDHTPIPPQMWEDYFAAIHALRPKPTTGASIVYTPMHGVGGWAVERALQDTGHIWCIVPEQAEPNGEFPTTQFPNPEEPGALDCAIKTAQSVNADAIVANDPDADRLAVALKNPEGVWTRLTGDQVGLIFAYHLGTIQSLAAGTLLANTIVSSSQLKQLADDFGVQYASTLTGFKWLANAGLTHLERTGQPLLLGYEEALGYSIGGLVQDKDGVSALLLMADIISHYKEKGLTLWDVLDEMALKYGLAFSTQHSIKRPGISGQQEIANMMDMLRSNPPITIAGSKIITMEDYLRLERSTKGVTVSITDMPKSNVLVYWLENQERVIARPSGTEPKIKFYFEAIQTVAAVEDIPQTKNNIQHRLNTLWESIQSMLS